MSAVVTFYCLEEEKENGNSSAVGEIFTCIDTGRVLRVQHNRHESIFCTQRQANTVGSLPHCPFIQPSGLVRLRDSAQTDGSACHDLLLEVCAVNTKIPQGRVKLCVPSAGQYHEHFVEETRQAMCV